MGLKKPLIAVSIMMVVGVVIALVLLAPRDDQTSTHTTETGLSESQGTAADFTEVEPGFELEDIRIGKFASLTLDASSGPISYMIAGGTEEYAGLVSAILGADRRELGKERTSNSTLTFVMGDLSTVTFLIHQEEQILTRSGVAYNTSPSLAEILEEAVRNPVLEE